MEVKKTQQDTLTRLVKRNTEPGIILLCMTLRVFYIVNDKMIEGY